MNWQYIKLALISFSITILIGLGYIYLKSKDVFPKSVSFTNIPYQNTEFTKNITLIQIFPSGSNGYKLKILEFAVKGKLIGYFPLQDFKREKDKFVYKREIGLSGRLIPLYFKIKIDNIKTIKKQTVENITEKELFTILKTPKYIFDLQSFVAVDVNYAKNPENPSDKDQFLCGIVSIDKDYSTVVCNLKRDIYIKRVLNVGSFLIGSTSRVSVSGNLDLNNESVNKLILDNYKNEIKNIIIADSIINPTMEGYILRNFDTVLKGLFKRNKLKNLKLILKVQG